MTMDSVNGNDRVFGAHISKILNGIGLVLSDPFVKVIVFLLLILNQNQLKSRRKTFLFIK
jgi:hypothetical protein